MITNFNIFAELAAGILNTTTQKIPTKFAIAIDDEGKLYTKSLVNLLKKYTSVNNDTVSKTEFGDVIIIDNNDVRLTNIISTALLNIPILSLVKDYDKVEKYIINFFEHVYITPLPSICTFCPIANLCGLNKGDFCVNKPINHEDNSIIYNDTIINVEEKVQIMYNFVKIGYDQYDIIDLFDRRFVDLEGTAYEVKVDRKGRKFLEYIK